MELNHIKQTDTDIQASTSTAEICTGSLFHSRVQAIRQLMKKDQVDAYIIPSSDPHISEYLPQRYKCIAYLSGFTGSAGTLVITETFAGLWTDARYFDQAEEQLKDTGFELVKLNVQNNPEYIQWLAGHLGAGATVGYDSWLVSIYTDDLLEELNLHNISIKRDCTYVDEIWTNRPDLPSSAAFCMDSSVAGQSVADKLQMLRKELKEFKAEFHIISSLDDIAWLFNIRGADVACNPVVLAFAHISAEKAILFTDSKKFSHADIQKLKDAFITLKPYTEFEEYFKSMEDQKILIDPKRSSAKIKHLLADPGNIIREVNPTTKFKAIKGPVEIANTRQTMQKDGVALLRFFKWLEENLSKEQITEVKAAEKLHAFRAEQLGFTGNSFDTIAAYRDHGALPHYQPDPKKETPLEARGLFLLDSGGQYLHGTTDVTRVIPLGPLTIEEKIDYTLVLKGMIEGSTAIFPKGTRGYQIDAITRKPLWDYTRDYGHGTGHGVGYFLNVHEGPQVFNKSNLAVDIEPGMITSVEPGIYRPGKHGIRIENLVLTVAYIKNNFAEFYTFETLTLAPIDTTAILTSLLEARHINWLNAYHLKVYEALSPLITKEEQDWLRSKTIAIG